MLCASAALALAFALGGPNPLLPTAVAIAGGLCALLIVLRLLDPPDLGLVVPGEQTGVGRRIGAFFGLLGAAGMAGGRGRHWGRRRTLPGALPAGRRPIRPARSTAPQPSPSSATGPILEVPTGPAVYALVYEGTEPPAFLDASPGAPLDGRDPPVPRTALEANWVEGASIVYIARASGLRRRLRELLRIGAGASASSWGGRLVWQLEDAYELRVAWRETTDPRAAEAELLAHFRADHRKPPFANDPHRLGR